jgi:hypothetical protein
MMVARKHRRLARGRWFRRVAVARRYARGVRAKRRRAVRGEACRKTSRRALCRPFPAPAQREGTGGMMRMRIAPRYSSQKGMWASRHESSRSPEAIGTIRPPVAHRCAIRLLDQTFVLMEVETSGSHAA